MVQDVGLECSGRTQWTGRTLVKDLETPMVL